MPRLKKAPDFIDPTGIDSFKYWSEAEFKEQVDGDTCWLACRLGFRVGVEKEKFRLARINAPELDKRHPEKTPEGKASLDYLNSLIEGKPLIIQSIKTRKGWAKRGGFGRYLVEIYVKEGDEYFNVNNRMVSDGFAGWYD